jgi:DUF4097 and DUF4098 domain-containing protein YvlB
MRIHRLWGLPLPILLVACAIPASAQVVRTFDVTPGGQLTVSVDRGAVEVRSGAETRVRVEVRRDGDSPERILEDYDIRFEVTGNQVLVESRARRDWFDDWGWRSRSPRFVVEVPSRFNLDLRTSGGAIDVSALQGEVRASTSGGALRFGSITGTVDGRTSGGSIDLQAADSATLRTSGGRITVGQVRGELTARTSGGSITVGRAQTVSATTSGGSISLGSIASAIDARTSGGSIMATLDATLSRDSRLESSGGSVVLSVPPTLAANLDARGRRVSVDLPVTADSVDRGHVRGTLNGGGPQLALRTSGGSIQIRRR